MAKNCYSHRLYYSYVYLIKALYQKDLKFVNIIAILGVMISIVAAIDSKRGLGKNNDLLFRIPEDFKRMKRLTLGHPLIMGRKTFESIGRVLPNRTNIVITRDKSFDPRKFCSSENCDVLAVGSLEEALRQAQGKPGSDEIFIFGGGQVFKEAIEKDLVDVLHLTLVEGDYGADTFFPDYSMFKEVSREDREDEKFRYSFLTLKKQPIDNKNPL